jgi:hypothetical protein
MSGASMQPHEAEAGDGEATPTDAKPVTPADAKHMQEKCEAAEGGSNAEVVEATLHAIMACVRAVVNAIARSASADPKDDEAGTTGACRLLEEPDGNAKLLMAAGATGIATIEGFRQLPHLRAEAAAAVPGTQTIYPPGQGPYAESPATNSVDRERPYPSLETREAIRRAIEEDEERST